MMNEGKFNHDNTKENSSFNRSGWLVYTAGTGEKSLEACLMRAFETMMKT